MLMPPAVKHLGSPGGDLPHSNFVSLSESPGTAFLSISYEDRISLQYKFKGRTDEHFPPLQVSLDMLQSLRQRSGTEMRSDRDGIVLHQQTRKWAISA